MKKRSLALAISILLIAVLFSGCSSKNFDNYEYVADVYYKGESNSSSSSGSNSNANTDDYFYDYEESVDTPSSDPIASMTVDSALQSSRKIILTAEINIETKAYADSISALQKAVESLGGYISGANSSVYNSTYSLHRANYTVRIPADRFSEFISMSDEMGNVTNANVWQDDITARYTDIEARLATLETKRERLLALMEKATEMYDIIELENALSDTVYQIESLTGERRSYDDRIAYSTAYVYIEEVRDLTITVAPPKTLSERISQTFTGSWQDFGEFCEDALVALVGALPTLLVLAIIAAVVIVILRVTAPRRAKKRAEHAERNRLNLEKWRAQRDATIGVIAPKKSEEPKE